MSIKDYQKGFKRGGSTGEQISEVVKKMYEKDKNGKIFLLIDWVKAFDSVLQRKLINEALKQFEAKGGKDREIEAILTYREFFNESIVMVGEE
jgi:hypothetical protein